jgi:hypothetical protein
MKHPGQVEREFDAMIERYGWAVQGVGEGADHPPFCYTCGLASRGLPDIIVFGLPMQVAHEFLNMMGRRFRIQGVPPLDTDLNDVAENFPARLLGVPRTEADKYMFAVKRRYPDYTAVQLVWTDRFKRWPWDDDFEPSLRERQPILRNKLN